MFCRQLLDVIANSVKVSYFVQFCSVLNTDDKCHELVQSIVQYYCTCKVIESDSCDDNQLNVLIKILSEQKCLNEKESNSIYKTANKKCGLLTTIHSNPMIFCAFLKTLGK